MLPDFTFNLSEKSNHKVFGWWDGAFKEIHVKVQVFVVAFVGDFPLKDVFQYPEVNYVTGFRVGHPTYGNLKHIVVPVPVNVAAFAVHLFVPFVRFVGIMKAMRSIEVGFSGYVNQCLNLLILDIDCCSWCFSKHKAKRNSGGFAFIGNIKKKRNT